MSSERKGNLNITEFTSMSSDGASGASNKSNLGQLENDNISDDDSHEDGAYAVFIICQVTHRTGSSRKPKYYRHTKIKNRQKQSFQLTFVT